MACCVHNFKKMCKDDTVIYEVLGGNSIECIKDDIEHDVTEMEALELLDPRSTKMRAKRDQIASWL